MPSWKVSVPHQLDKPTATEKLKGFATTLRDKYGDHVKNLEEVWAGDTLQFGFSTAGIHINGNVAVDDDTVQIDGRLPLAALMFKGMIEKEVRDALQQALA